MQVRCHRGMPADRDFTRKSQNNGGDCRCVFRLEWGVESTAQGVFSIICGTHFEKDERCIQKAM